MSALLSTQGFSCVKGIADHIRGLLFFGCVTFKVSTICVENVGHMFTDLEVIRFERLNNSVE